MRVHPADREALRVVLVAQVVELVVEVEVPQAHVDVGEDHVILRKVISLPRRFVAPVNQPIHPSIVKVW